MMRDRRTQQVVTSQRYARVPVSALAVLCLLLVFPVYALSRLSIGVDWRLLAGVPVLLSLLTFLAYRSDKQRAEAGEWRIPEMTLHGAELIGGWPGAFLAQRIFRHKTAKTSYQIQFWLIVLAHQYVAIESVLGWRFTRFILRYFLDSSNGSLS